jgi:hypothetical protein
MPERGAKRESDSNAGEPTAERAATGGTAGAEAPAGGAPAAEAPAGGGAEGSVGDEPAAVDGGEAGVDGAAGEAEETPAFLNRAARRAGSRGANQQYQAPGRGASPAGRGPAQSRRQWGNRRSGG